MTEAGAIVAEATPTGGTTLPALFGLGQLTAIIDVTSTTQTLATWAGAATSLSQLTLPHDLLIWLYSYLGFDLLFIAGYATAGFTLLPRTRPPAPITRSPACGKSPRAGCWLAWWACTSPRT